MIRAAIIASVAIAACSQGGRHLQYSAPEVFATEILTATVGASVRTAAAYTGTVYMNCDGAADYALGDSTVEADAGDADAKAGVVSFTADGQYIAIFSASGTKVCNISKFYNETLSVTQDVTLATITRSTLLYTGDVQVMCNRQNYHAIGDESVTPTGQSPFGLASHVYRTTLSNQVIGFATTQSVAKCGIIGVQ